MDLTSPSSPPPLCLPVSTLSRTASSTTISPQKLKNACDLCSAFKIRCDKGKPSCGRCTNLNQPCSYSPARRAGRPHRFRQQQHQKQQQTPVPEQEQHHHQQLESLFAVTSSCFHSHPASFDAGDFDWGNYDWGMDLEPTLDEPNPAAATVTPYQTPRPPRELKSADQNHAVFLPTTNKSDSSTQISLSNSQNEPINQQFKEQQQPPPGHRDCARIATSIVEQLDPSAQVRLAPLPTTQPSANTTTASCQRLLTILICPCSEQPVIALLVASACIALMDGVLHQQQRYYHHETPRDETLSSSWPPTPPSSRHQHSRSLPLLPDFTAFNDCHSSDQGGFEGLAKIAKVVLRFTQRYTQYEGPGGRATRDMLEPVALLLRSKLQAVTEEATGRLVL